MQRRILAIITIVLLLPMISQIRPTQQTDNNNFEESTLSQPSEFDILQKLEDNVKRVDRDGDIIADSLELDQGYQDVIILFDSFDSVPQGDYIGQYRISGTMDRLPGVFATVDTVEMYSLIQQFPEIQLIEKDLPIESHLAYSTTQLGIRSPIWDLGFTGSSTHSIAIVDTGIDNTHTAFTNRIIANYNAMDNNQTFPYDQTGHGTHVASIAAGQNPTGSNQYVITERGEIPSSGGSVEILLANIADNSEINIKIDWGATGIDNPTGSIYSQIITTDGNFLGCGSCDLTDSSGYLDTNVTVNSGSYYLTVGNEVDAAGSTYEVTVTVPFDQSIPSSTERRHFGVSPDTNLVNVKVLDSVDQGTSSDLVNGLNWIINNREVYNISVVNLSLGFSQIVATIDTLMEDLVNNGILPIVSAGNSGTESSGIYSPGSAPEALTVGAVNRVNEMAYYSSYGDSSVNTAAMKPDVLAPGGSTASTLLGFDTSYTEGFGTIVAADPNNLEYDLASDDLTGEQGTSMAAPHIAGLANVMIEYILEQGDWDFNSRSDILKIKRAILAGTFEAANIGLAREELPNVDHGSSEPSLDRTGKDYFEGWGVVDAQAAFNALNNTLGINSTHHLDFNHEDPFAQQSYAWNIELSNSINYTFALNIPEGADVDIVVYDANSGPLHDGADYGDLSIITSSTGTGDEYLTFAPDTNTDAIVVIKMVESNNSQDSVAFTITEGEITPKISIISPANNAAIVQNSVTIEYEATIGTVTAYLNGTSQGTVASGDILTDLVEGFYILNLTLADPNNNLVFDVHNFTITIPEITSTTTSSQSETTSSTSSTTSTIEETTNSTSDGNIGAPTVDFLYSPFTLISVLLALPIIRNRFR